MYLWTAAKNVQLTSYTKPGFPYNILLFRSFSKFFGYFEDNIVGFFYRVVDCWYVWETVILILIVTSDSTWRLRWATLTIYQRSASKWPLLTLLSPRLKSVTRGIYNTHHSDDPLNYCLQQMFLIILITCYPGWSNYFLRK
jgi:hypothetical protein